jgi:hypothetical protein
LRSRQALACQRRDVDGGCPQRRRFYSAFRKRRKLIRTGHRQRLRLGLGFERRRANSVKDLRIALRFWPMRMLGQGRFRRAIHPVRAARVLKLRLLSWRLLKLLLMPLSRRD